MIGTIVFILVVLAVLYFLWANDKLNTNSINQSSPSLNQSSESVQQNEAGQYNVKFNSPKIKSLRVLYGDNGIGKITVGEGQLSYADVIDLGNRTVGSNTVFLGVLNDASSAATATSSTSASPQIQTRNTANFNIKQFKNLFIVFKGIEHSEIKVTSNMARYEAEGMVYCLIDSSSSSAPDLRDVSYPIMVLTNNANVQLKLKEWNYTQINDSGTVFIKNEKSFRLQ
ncbi:occlusion-derived virus envelope protein ODV-E25 [Spodoptera littoralis nucleopolyhedrovirus]|uniref:Occlusion-derived virus envelope protein ODV-E25 n=1 Tax=Spodoptera littoralis nuclear polyhedrosis virus TaxID=10456 RepID=M1JTH0_NPVSL|nr:occlusion-derived virus envelope protein ODV-E25 [Spodoptera littoralis nucleopolyhedrovirus]AGE89935.1 occlusion-derived virus envelope protein ODV-E25 [Spodoptera littoralis nucleopolyhedrovirus]AYU75269.1 odv-e25 occlusion-derived virus envelope protein ODV-E25 [Spodoptera littoralis nucleopolyhedrovirus]